MKNIYKSILQLIIYESINVCSGNAENFDFKLHQAFVYEQIESLKQKFNVDYDTFFIIGKGIKGYLKIYSILEEKINEFQTDIVHAHFGLSGLLAVFAKKSTCSYYISWK